MRYRQDTESIKGIVKIYDDGQIVDIGKQIVGIAYQKAWESETLTLSAGNMAITVPVDEVLKVLDKKI